MDKENFPRDKPCAGWLSPAVWQKLEVDPEQYRRGRVLQEIREFRTGIMYQSDIVTRYPVTVSYGIRRSEFDHFLLLSCPTPTLLGERIHCLERSDDGRGWVINGSIEAALLVGAGGHHCPVARTLGATFSKEPVIAAMVTEFEMGEEQSAHCGVPAGVPILSFASDLKGYGWLVRKGSFVNIGLGSFNASGLRQRTAEYFRYLRTKYSLTGDALERFRGHAYLPYSGNSGRSMVADGALLVGDAAGLSYRESGEGILPAVESALLAARIIVEAGGDYRRERLARYAAALAKRFGSAGGGFELPEAAKRLGGSILLNNSFLTRRLVLDRWFLHN